MRIIDLHTHGIAGFDTRTDDPAQIAKIAEAQGREGVSDTLLSLYSGPIPVMRNQMKAVCSAMNTQVTGPADICLTTPRPARILGIHLEGPFLNPEWCGALDPATFVDPRESTFRELVEGYEDVVKMVTIAPERPGAADLTRTMSRMGIAVSMGHSGATWNETELCFRAGARSMTHIFNAMKPFHHREPGITGFGLLNQEIYVEIIGDLHHLSANALDLVFRIKKRDRILLVSDSIATTRPTAEPGVEVLAKDQRLTGGTLSLPAAARLLAKNGFKEELITEAITTNPRMFLEST